MFSHNAALDAIGEPNTKYQTHYKTLIRLYNATADYWTRNVSASSLTGKILGRLFFSLLMNQRLGLDSAYLPGR